MGLFDRHDYGRDYYRGEGRGMGERLRGAWNRFEGRVERGMHGGYDRGLRGGRGYDASDFAYRGLEGPWSTARNRGAHDVQWDWRRAGDSPYDQDLMRGGWGGGYDRDYGARGYDRGMQGGGMLGRTRFGGARRSWQQGGPDRYDAQSRGWNGGPGDEPGYPRREWGGWGRGR
jgi:hypothetical protein